MLSTLESCQRYLSADLSPETPGQLPIDTMDSLRSTLQVFEQTSAASGMSVILDAPDLAGHVLADPRRLPLVLQAILEVLRTDAEDRSEITLQVEVQITDVVLTIRNRGLGLSAERLAKALRDAAGNLPEFRRLREAIAWVESWEGRLVVSSDLGQGLTVRLVLKRFLPQGMDACLVA
jgi:signal transduction histidine kinase